MRDEIPSIYGNSENSKVLDWWRCRNIFGYSSLVGVKNWVNLAG